MADYAISYANLSTIERNLSNIGNALDNLSNGIDSVDAGVNQVNQNVQVVYSEVGKLAKDFGDFVQLQVRQNNLQDAKTMIIQIRQELEQKYGHYAEVRRTATGILEADDLGIVKQTTIANATEELMISTPNYWLAPCLVALAAWINDQPELAERALRESIRRNDEKTSLFFALVCRRAGRKAASLKWTQRYLANQDERDLDRKAIIILDAFASGLLGSDSEGVVSKQMADWMDSLSAAPGFVEQQITQWSDAINLKRKPVDEDEYAYLRKYSKTWSQIESTLEGARLHADILSYFMDIFEQEVSNEPIKAQLDEILNSLVSDFDDEELPLRKEEKYYRFVIDFNGDVDRARQNMQIEQSAFETHKDFTQLLTDAAMKPESSNASPSTQKFAIALSKDWIKQAYSNVVATNRRNIPMEIGINVDTFNDKTTNGSNEAEVIANWNNHVQAEKQAQLDNCKLTGFDQFCLYGGIAIGVLGIVLIFFAWLLGIIVTIAGVGLVIKHFSAKKAVDTGRANIEEQFEKKRSSGEQIIRATIAEAVDYRREFARKEKESQLVLDFLEQISPEQYVRKLADSNRKIRINN